MSRRFWRRLAGCIAIEVALLAAAPPEYRASAAASGPVRAVVIEDRRGTRAVFVEADFAITRAVSDFVAVQLLKQYEIDRADVVISGRASGEADPAPILAAIEQALSKLEPATLVFSGAISIRSAGACVATLYPVRLDGCRDGATVHGPIRAAFQMIDVPHPLQSREAGTRRYPVQAVAIGKSVTVLALSGDVPVALFAAPGRVVVPFANDVGAMPEGLNAGVRRILQRVR